MPGRPRCTTCAACGLRYPICTVVVGQPIAATTWALPGLRLAITDIHLPSCHACGLRHGTHGPHARGARVKPYAELVCDLSETREAASFFAHNFVKVRSGIEPLK
eukprot:713831-Prymnesium_polylepis.1